MFKSIQWKLVLLYLLLVIFIITIIGVLLLKQVERMYYDNFQRSMKASFDTTGFSNINIDAADFDDLRSRVDSYKSIFLVDGIVRNIHILDNSGVARYSTDPQVDVGTKQFAGENVRNAILGRVGSSINTRSQVLDFAQPVILRDGSKYIVYVTDKKTDLTRASNRLKQGILASMLLSLLLSTIIGFLFARTITVPIKNLADKARKISEGDFEQRLEEKSHDEIGQLTKDFNYMAKELKNTLSEISSEKSKIEAILVHMTDGVMAFDHDGSVIHINPAAEKLIKNHYSGRTFDEIFKNLDIEITLGEFVYLGDDSVRERKAQVGDNIIKFYFVSFKNESGRIGGVIVVLQDITEQHRLDNMRREFVANVSHELRTPLTTIKSYIETLMDGAIDEPETASEFLNVIDNETDRMTRLVRDLLDLSKLDYQQVKWKKESVALDPMIRDIVKKLNIEAKNKEQTLEYFVTSNVPEIIMDRDRIEQVVINIISNAIKYTQKGGQVSVYLGSVYNDVYIKVIDNGMGIPKKDLPRIFERFYRVDKARTRELGGTGLGLAIAKEIIEAHGGSINISSQFGKGTEVVINLPVVSEDTEA